MPRALWKGAISFGMVTIPVSLATVVEEKDVRFRQLHKKCMQPIKQQRWCPVDEEVVEYGDIIKGYEWAPGEYVTIDEKDFEKVAVESSRVIEIKEFVPLDQIDPVFFDHSYFLYPEEVGMKAFNLLVSALKDDQRVGIAKLTMRQREYLCAIRIYENTLLLNTLHYADEIRAVEALPEGKKSAEVTAQEVEMAKTLIGFLAADFDPEKYHDQYREGLMEIIVQKREGKVIELKKPQPQAAQSTDLMAALRASVEAVRKGTAPAAAQAPAEAEAAPKRRKKSA